MDNEERIMSALNRLEENDAKIFKLLENQGTTLEKHGVLFEKHNVLLEKHDVLLEKQGMMINALVKSQTDTLDAIINYQSKIDQRFDKLDHEVTSINDIIKQLSLTMHQTITLIESMEDRLTVTYKEVFNL